jgi:uncharacterized protein YcbX
MHRGRVQSLHRWPVKSVGGEDPTELALDRRGVLGDRAHAVHDPRRDQLLTARVAPGLLRWRAAAAPADPHAPPTLTAPDGRVLGWHDPALPAALADDLRRDVRLVHDPAGLQDLERSVLVTFEATRAGIEAELGAPLDLRRFRTNVHVDAPGLDPRAELAWEGRRLRIGDAELELLHPCKRCVITVRDPDTTEVWADVLRTAPYFGINARPLGPARIAVGDPVELV